MNLLASLLSMFLLIYGCVPSSLKRDESDEVSRYAGLVEIDTTKNHLILVGDTQRTSLWEFWRERNDRERKIIINEIARRDPAFVLHLGDLTARGGSENQWQEFDELHMTLSVAVTAEEKASLS